MKHRMAQNHISSLTIITGGLAQTDKEIEDEILQFYKNLLGTTSSSLPAIQPELLQRGATLNRDQ